MAYGRQVGLIWPRKVCLLQPRLIATAFNTRCTVTVLRTQYGRVGLAFALPNECIRPSVEGPHVQCGKLTCTVPCTVQVVRTGKGRALRSTRTIPDTYTD